MGLSAHEPRPSTGPTPLQQVGVSDTILESRDLSLHEVPDMTLLRLHSLEQPATLAAHLAQDGIVLPLDTNAAGGRDPAALCLRPGEWLLLHRSQPPADLLERIAPRLDTALSALLDVSDGLGVFRLTGAASPWLLVKLCGLDARAGVSTGQHGARTRMGDVAVVLHFCPEPDGAPRFDLVYDRSIAKYLWDLLNDAAPHAEDLYHAHGAAA